MPNTLVLSGGLGNQMFQYVAAREIFESARFSIDYSLLNPTLLSNGFPELSELTLIEDIIWECPKRFRITKFLGLLVLKGSSMRTDGSIKRRLFWKLFPIFKRISRLVVFKGHHIVTPNGIGYSPVVIDKNKSNVLIGNFHSYAWFEKCPESFRSELELKQKSSLNIEYYTRIAKEENPLVIHLRFGDFLKIPELNVITPSYFMKSLEVFIKDNKLRNIWLFSNDVNRAMSFLGKKSNYALRIVNPLESTSGEILELLKLGQHYVISNSTFGWWGARLSRNFDAQVIVPKEWYSTMEVPFKLIPESWHCISTLSKSLEDDWND
jgi:hypothetical protein